MKDKIKNLATDFGKRLQHYIDIQGETFNSVAPQLGVTPSSLYRYLSHPGILPNTALLIKLQEIFPKLNVAWLLGGEGDMEHQFEEGLEGDSKPTTERESVESWVMRIMDLEEQFDALETQGRAGMLPELLEAAQKLHDYNKGYVSHVERSAKLLANTPAGN